MRCRNGCCAIRKTGKKLPSYMHNGRPTRPLELWVYNGMEVTLEELAGMTGLSRKTLLGRIQRGTCLKKPLRHVDTSYQERLEPRKQEGSEVAAAFLMLRFTA